MQPLSVMLNACSDALRRMSANGPNDWHADYCAVVDPTSVLEMGIIIKSLLQYIETKDGPNIVTEAVKVRLGTVPEPPNNGSARQ